jgi:hypothetical protein
MSMKKMCSVAALVFISLLFDRNCLAAEPNTRKYFPILNIKATSPQAVSLEFGIAYEFLESQQSDTGIGPFISYEPGYNGQKAHIGIAYTHFGSGIPFGSIFVAKLSAAYYQPWDASTGTTSREDLYGAEITITYNIFLASGGLYYNQEKRNYTGSVGVGIGW